MATVAPLNEPLLKAEEGQAGIDINVSKGKEMSEARKKAKELRKLKKSRQVFMERIGKIVTSESYRPVLLMIAFCCFIAAGACWYEYDRTFNRVVGPKFFSAGVIAVLASFLGQVNGTYLVFTSVELQEEIEILKESTKLFGQENERFKENLTTMSRENQKLKERVSMTKRSVEELHRNNDDMADQLEAFKKLSDQMQHYAAKGSNDFKEAAKAAKKMYEDMDQMTKESEKNLIFKVAQDMEYVDGEEGLNEEEFTSLVSRLPRRTLQHAVPADFFQKNKDQEGVISYEKLEEFVEQIMEGGGAQQVDQEAKKSLKASVQKVARASILAKAQKVDEQAEASPAPRVVAEYPEADEVK